MSTAASCPLPTVCIICLTFLDDCIVSVKNNHIYNSGFRVVRNKMVVIEMKGAHVQIVLIELIA